jgi:hypothetical protein
MASSFVSMHGDIIQRPAMRRKSSAQNLLTSFKASPSPTPPLAPISTSVLPVNSYANISTPIASSFLGREWDSQSMRSDAVTSTIGGSSPALPQGTSVEYLRDLVQKRIITLTYIRSIHEGYVLYVSSYEPARLDGTSQEESLVSYHLDDQS